MSRWVTTGHALLCKVAAIRVGKTVQLAVSALVVLVVGAHLCNPLTLYDIPFGSAEDLPTTVRRQSVSAAPLADHLAAACERVVDLPRGAVHLFEFAPVSYQVFCASNRRMDLGQKIVNDIVRQGALQLLNVARIASIEVSQNESDVHLRGHDDFQVEWSCCAQSANCHAPDGCATEASLTGHFRPI